MSRGGEVLVRVDEHVALGELHAQVVVKVEGEVEARRVVLAVLQDH